MSRAALVVVGAAVLLTAAGGSAPPSSVSVTGAGAYAFTRHVGDLTLHAPGTSTIAIRQLGDTIYLSLPGRLSPRRLSGRLWPRRLTRPAPPPPASGGWRPHP